MSWEEGGHVYQPKRRENASGTVLWFAYSILAREPLAQPIAHCLPATQKRYGTFVPGREPPAADVRSTDHHAPWRTASFAQGTRGGTYTPGSFLGRHPTHWVLTSDYQAPRYCSVG